MSLSRWAAAIVLAGFSLAATVAAPRPPRDGEGAAPTPPAAKPKLTFEAAITHGDKTTKATTPTAALTQLQALQKRLARTATGKAPAEGEGADGFTATFTLNGDTQEVKDPAEAEKLCKRINEALVKARKSGEDLATVKIPTEDAPLPEAAPGAGEKPGPRRPIRGKNGEGPPMNPQGPFPGGVPPMGGFNGPPGAVLPMNPQRNGNGGGLEGLVGRLPPQAQALVMQRIAQWSQMNNGAVPDGNTVMQIIGQVMQQLQNGQGPRLPPAPGRM